MTTKSQTQIISVIQMKGGVGKTNCTVNLAAVLARYHEKRVLLVDFDPQTNATLSLMKEKDWIRWAKSNGTLAEVLGMERDDGKPAPKDLKDYIVKDVCPQVPGLDLLPSHLKMTFIDTTLASHPGRERIFARKLRKLRDAYDIILCDCPPSLMTVTQNALYASSHYLIPMEPDYLSTLGLRMILERTTYLKKNLQLAVKCLGVVFTRVRSHLQYHAATMEGLKDTSPFKRLYFFESFIPENITLSEAPLSNLPVIVYDTSSTGARAFREFGQEFVTRLA